LEVALSALALVEYFDAVTLIQPGE